MPPEAAVATRPAAGIGQSRADALRDLINALKRYPPESARSDRKGFATLLEDAQVVLEAEDRDLAHRLGVSRPTIWRWVRGETAPHPIARAAVLLDLADWAEEKLNIHLKYAKRKAA